MTEGPAGGSAGDTADPGGPGAAGQADVRVVWSPEQGGDLVGTCRCGASFASPDPKQVWGWYAEHAHDLPERGTRRRSR